jgi:hypothetical protein
MFCKTVWNGIHILPDGYIRLCCIGGAADPDLDLQRARDRDGNVMHILTHDIKDIMNSDKHRQVRSLNVKNPAAWSSHCECCENREIVTDFNRNHENRSRRLYLMRIDSDSVVNETNFQNAVTEDGTCDWMPSSLDVRFGNLCNQRCIQCSPIFSNQWYDEWNSYYGELKFGQGNIIEVKKDNRNRWAIPSELQWFEDPRWWPKFEQMMPYLKHIYITGGEPMITPAHDEMLDRLINSGLAKNIMLEYDSNCTAINNKIIARWDNFKNVDIRASMDAIGDQYNLIRSGGNWETFAKNIKRLKQYQSESGGKIRLQHISSCLQIPTAFSIIESEEWCRSIGVDFHMRFLETPEHLSINTLPPPAKREMIEYYSKHIDTSSKAELIVKYLTPRLLKGYSSGKTKEYFRWMDFLDKSRNTNWREVFPQVAEMLRRYE